MTVLDEIIEYKRSEELPRRMCAGALELMRDRAAATPPPRDFVTALRYASGVALIAEVKKASPSKGLLCPDFEPVHLATTYATNGAAAISVLTDEPYFQGSLEYLTRIREHLDDTPLLRKDFIVHPYQVYEARAAGADALLLIAAVLSDEQLAELLALTRSLGMAALIETHNAGEVQRVLPLKPRLLGVNNRNLRDFSVDLNTCLSLRPMVPPEVCFVAESGIHTRADVARLAAAGVDAMLIGEALVVAENVGAKVRELVDGGQ